MTTALVLTHSNRQLFQLLGDPVSHSLSPAIQNAAFDAAGQNAHYTTRRVSGAECGPVLRKLALDGGGGNVTVPHKEAVVPFLDCKTDSVTATGACNTFWAQNGDVWGDNTDVAAFLGAYQAVLKHRPRSLDVLLLGAGGAARAVVFALLQRNEVARVHLWNRTPGRAQALIKHFRDPRVRLLRQRRGVIAGLVVNATSVGIDGHALPLDLDTLGAHPQGVVDLVYNRRTPSPLARAAKSLGVARIDGRDILVRQAEAAFACWFGEAPPPGVMARAIDAN